ncbi:MAG: hypothetical protein FWC67_01595, partial [Defluviitaleaceae bacterium]|nr:hypothetical protein [Defluviitaleaceae bacterium]
MMKITRTMRKCLATLMASLFVFAVATPTLASELGHESTFLQEMALLEELMESVGDVPFAATGTQTF